MTRGFSLFLLLLAFSLSACGFRPLYERSGDAAPSEILARVALAPTSSGQVDVLHTQLRRYFGKRSAPSALYVLNLDVSLKEQDQLIRRDAQVTRHNVVYGVRYDLRSRDGGKEPVFKDYLRLTISYNRRTSQFATLTARRSAHRRAATLAASTIRNRVMLFLQKEARQDGFSS